MLTRPGRKPSRKRRLQSAGARYICDPRPGQGRAGTIRDDAPPSTTALGPACGHLFDRGLAVGSSRACGGLVRGADTAARLQAMAGRAHRYAVAGDDADRLYRAGDSAVSAKTGRPLAAYP